MTVNQVLEMGFVKDRTEIFIRKEDFSILAHGNWYQDNVLEYLSYGIEFFTWQDNDKLYINTK